MRGLDWYRRLADVPGVGYTGSPDVSRVHLRGHDAAPRVETFDLDGRRQQSLRWSGGTTSASPASQLMDSDLKEVPTPKLLRDLADALELPGEPTDYHFIVQHAATALWNRRRSEPDVLNEVERLCWLDIRLVQACPDAVSDEYTSERKFYSVTAFKNLITLYQREGALCEALEVAEIAERFDQLADKAEELRQRMAVLEAEDP